jgi:hypothetical protein
MIAGRHSETAEGIGEVVYNLFSSTVYLKPRFLDSTLFCFSFRAGKCPSREAKAIDGVLWRILVRATKQFSQKTRDLRF